MLFHSRWIMQFRPGWWLGAHSHDDFHHIVLVLEGQIRTRYQDQEVVAGPGEALLYPTGVRHGHCTEGNQLLHMLSLQWGGGDEHLDLSTFDRQRDHDGRLRHQLQWLASLEPAPGNAELVEALALSIVAEYGRLQRFEEVDPVERLRRYVNLHLNETISLDDLAAISGLSKFHFSRRFRSLCGETPMAMVNRLRVERATMLLYQTEDNLERIAEAVGFADASTLSHAFRRIRGVSPGSLRQARHRQASSTK
jgi:AraC-like DNA-binding protein/uncharacterized protein YjlB